MSRADSLTDETARQILIHNETGRALCGWKPEDCRRSIAPR